MSRGLLRTIAIVLLFFAAVCPVTAEFNIPPFALFFTARQGRWTLLIAWTVLMATTEEYSRAMDGADKSLHVAESSGDDAKIATSLRYIALLKELKGDFGGAAPDLERALALREKTLGPDDPGVADQLIALAEIDSRLGKQADATSLLQRAQHIREKAIGTDSAEVADVLLERAALLMRQGQLPAAEELGRSALAIYEMAPEHDDVDIADALLQIANVCSAEGHMQDAEQLYDQSLHLQEQAMGADDDPALIPTITSFAAFREKEGRHNDATILSLRAARIREAALLPGTESEQNKQWRDLVGQSFQNYNLGEFGKEIEISKKALRYAEARFGPEDFRVSAFLMILARQYHDGQAAFTKAGPLLRRAVRMDEKTLGTEEPGLAEIYNEDARFANNQLKPSEAEKLFRHGVRIQSRMMNLQVSEDPYLQSPRLELAQLYRQEGRVEDAQKLLEEALLKQAAIHGPKAPNALAMSKLLSGLAEVYRQEGRSEDAATQLRSAIVFNDKAWGLGWGVLKRNYEASLTSQLGDIYADQKKYSDAEIAYRRSLKFNAVLGGRTQTIGKIAAVMVLQGKYAAAESMLQEDLSSELASKHPANANGARKMLAGQYVNQGRYQDAELLLEASLKEEETTLDPNSPELAMTLFDLGMNNFALNRAPAAADYFDRSLGILEDQLQYYFTYMSEKDRLQILSIVNYRFPAYFSFVEKFHVTDPQLTGRMYDLLLWQKGLVARSIESLRQRVSASGDAEALKLLDQLAAMRSQLSTMIAQTSIGPTDSQKTISILKADVDDAERKLVERSQTFAASQQQRVRWQQVLGSLRPNGADASIEFVRFPYHDGKSWTRSVHYAALVITPDSAVPVFVSLGDASTLEGQPFKAYLQWVAKSPASSSLNSATSFYQAFWKKIEATLGPTKPSSERALVYVSYDGILNVTSLGVVPTDDGHLLMEKFDLRMVNSTADLLREPLPLSANTAVLVGNPKFDLSAVQQKAALTLVEKSGNDKAESASSTSIVGRFKLDPQSRDLLGNQNCPPPTPGHILCPLPGTEVEVDDIYEELVSHQWKVAEPYTQERALSEVVKQVKHPKVLHIATHGFFPRSWRNSTVDMGYRPLSEDPMLQSGMYFAGAERALDHEPASEGVDDGVLTAYEISTLDLQGTELVVFSACGTGFGEVEAGEGIFGLRRALQEAGAATVLMSLWSVPDDETRELMKLFYQNWLGGQDKPTALWNAQKELRLEVQTRYQRDLPYYWGAFVLVGR